MNEKFIELETHKYYFKTYIFILFLTKKREENTDTHVPK